MLYRKFKGFTFSEIGIGCYALGGAYGQKDPQQFRKLLEWAVHLGITFFDTSDSYGELAEGLLGEIIKPHRNSIFLATKVGMRADKKYEFSRKAVQQACEGSLRRLQTDYIDLYQIHYDDPITTTEETVSALDDLVQSGKIRAYGIGHLPMERIISYLETGRIFTGQFELSAVARDTLKEILPVLLAHQAGLIAFSVTGRGLLSGKYSSKPNFGKDDIRSIDPLFQRDRYQSAMRIVDKFTKLGRLYGKSCVQTAIAWTLAQPGIYCALTGPSSIAHLEENLGGSGWEISSEHILELETFFLSEDERLINDQKQTIRQILTSQLPSDQMAAIQDLIYVMETSITQQWTHQDVLMPFFMDVFNARKEINQTSINHLENIRKDLQIIILPAMEINR